MKRKKWSELEEQTLLSKYSDLLNSGTLPKLKTREKKFKPIADHVNSLHHLQDPVKYPFKWSWRDVSIKVQNMRHQYLGVKQKIRTPNNEFNWSDGEIHWENFFKYKQVFGDIEMPDSSVAGPKDHGVGNKCGGEDDDDDDDCDGDDGICGILGYDEMGSDDMEGDDEDGRKTDEVEEDVGGRNGAKLKRGCKGRSFRVVGGEVLRLRDAIVGREERRREREWRREDETMESEAARKERELQMEKRLREREEEGCGKEMELEEMRLMWAKREFETRVRLEREIDEERRRRMKLEEKREEEEMAWRERIVEMQIEHEKQMMQMQVDAWHNQLQILGSAARLLCQFFGSGGDGLGGGLACLPPQVLQNLQHQGGLGDSGKSDATLPSEFL